MEALLIVEVEGSEDEIENLPPTITEIAKDYAPLVIRISQSAAESARIRKGRKAAFGAFGQISDYRPQATASSRFPGCQRHSPR